MPSLAVAQNTGHLQWEMLPYIQEPNQNHETLAGYEEHAPALVSLRSTE